MPKMGLRNIFFTKTTPSSPPRRSFSDSIMDENMESAGSIISKWDNNYSPSDPLFSNTRQEAKQYLDAVMRLQSTMQHLVARDSSSATLVQAQSLMQLAMKRLQMEFYRILAQNRDTFHPPSIASTDCRSATTVSDDDDDSSSDDLRFSLSSVAMADLKAIAHCMVSAGYSKECVKVYTLVRKSIVDEALYKLGLERLTFSQVQKMDWETLDSKIKRWLNAVKIAVRTLFHGERTLCDYVFGSPERKIAESCFAAVIGEAAALMFGLPENVAKCKKTPEKMFRTLDLYEAMSENCNQIASIFSSEATSSVRSQATASLTKLREAIRTMLTDFESAIQKESSKIPVPGGGIHPLTRYVMNYLAFLADYRDVLEEVVADWPQHPLPESYYEQNRSSEIAERMAWLILVLLCKLDGKAELYKDVALSYLFLANNMQYIVVKVRQSNLGLILGEEWLTNHESKVKEYVSKYERVGWSKVFLLLPENPTAENEARGTFNAAFREACRVHSSWVVPDPTLREKIKASISSKLVPRYKETYRVGSDTDLGLTADDMDHYLGEILLCGSGRGESGTVSSSRTPSPPSHRFKIP